MEVDGEAGAFLDGLDNSNIENTTPVAIGVIDSNADRNKSKSSQDDSDEKPIVEVVVEAEEVAITVSPLDESILVGSESWHMNVPREWVGLLLITMLTCAYRPNVLIPFL